MEADPQALKPRRRRCGFTLIELLAAMAVLLLVVALLARVFGAASLAWRNGNKRIESNNSGRAAMEFMARELGGIIFSRQGPTFALDSDANNFLGMASDRLTFVTLSHRAEYRSSTKYRDVQQVHYAVAEIPGTTNRYGLYRWVTESFDSGFFTSYEVPDWYTDMYDQSPSAFNAGLLADNVRNFEVFITPLGETEPQSDYDFATDGPPAVIDIYLEVLAEDDAIRASFLSSNQDFLNAASRRFATRIFVQNRGGYGAD